MSNIQELFPTGKLDFCKYAPKSTYSNNWNLPFNHMYFVCNVNPYNFNVAFSNIVGFRVNGELKEI